MCGSSEFQYTNSFLHQYSGHKYTLAPALQQTLSLYKILRTSSPEHKKTYRGRRGGQRIKSFKQSLITKIVPKDNFDCEKIQPDKSERKNRHQNVSSSIKIGTWNARSINNKLEDIDDLFENHNLQILTLSETWHENSDATIIKQLKAKGYRIAERARDIHTDNHNISFVNHGGVAIISKPNFTLHPIVHHSFESFEITGTKIKHNNSELIIFSVYRPGSEPLTTKFFDELSILLQFISSYTCSIFLAGDLNIRLDKKDETFTIKFNKLLRDYGCKQLVDQVTHVAGGILDVAIVRENISPISVAVKDVGLSDHYLINTTLDFSPPPLVYKEIVSRDWKHFDIKKFRDLLGISKLRDDNYLSSLDVHSAVENYNSTLTNLLDTVAPITRKVCRQRQSGAHIWFDGECRRLKKEMRKLERTYRRTKLLFDCQEWKTAQTIYSEITKKKKASYWTSQLESNKKNPKALWGDISRICGERRQDFNSTLTAESLLSQFKTKVENIRDESSLNLSKPSSDIIACDIKTHEKNMQNFQKVDVELLEKIIMSQPNKHCTLDPVPTWLLKSCVKELLNCIAHIVNSSIDSDIVPSLLKSSLITPILKKDNLDPNSSENYRPISNIPFLSKILEKVISRQLTDFLDSDNFLAKYQSAYRRYHSTETSTTRILSDLITQTESGKLTLISFLDMSAAFDTVDHSILFSKLQSEFGLQSRCISWLTSYLTNRKYKVNFNGRTTDENISLYGVPQGSVLGPILFNLYTNQLENIVQHLGFQTHAYADDRILYKSCPPESKSELISDVSSCINQISIWMSMNKLKLNPTKTEFLWLASPRRQHLINNDPIRIQNAEIVPSKHVKFLGIHIDSALSMDTHISSVLRSSFYSMRQLKPVRRCLSTDAAKTLINALIVSRVDYCNAILMNLPKYQLHRIQLVLNAAARFIHQINRFSHISPTLQNLHWLKSPERVEFKTCLLVFKALHNMAPTYLSELCIQFSPNDRHVSLRSRTQANNKLVEINTVNKPKYFDRAFSVSGPKAWNSLPVNIRSSKTLDEFKKELKTFLFMKSYPDYPLS
jgi:exonuclease III